MKYGRNSPPEVTEESPELIAIQDAWDETYHLYPTDGIIQDHIYHTLGWETTNLFALWSAVAGLSSLAGRAVSLRAGQDMFPNFYIILVGPPGISRKSTAMDRWTDIEEAMWPKIPEHLAEVKKTPIIRAKATPEFLFTQMANRELEHSDGEFSDAVLKVRVSELDNFLSRASYTSTMISKLTDFYDCRKYDTDGVLGRNNGKLAEIRNIYATLFGCTTPSALQNTLPEEAFGGGFMSRATIVSQDIPDLKRKCSLPYFPEDAPNVEEMAHRLAWIVTYKNGEYTLTPEAFRFYDKWYGQVMDEIKSKASKGDADHRDNRLTIQVLKLATLFSYQRYSLDRRVTLQDLVFAINIMDYTLRKGTQVIDNVTSELSVNAQVLKFYRILKNYPEGTTKRELCRKHNYLAKDVDQMMHELEAKGLGHTQRVKLPPKSEGGRSRTQLNYRLMNQSDSELDFIEASSEKTTE